MITVLVLLCWAACVVFAWWWDRRSSDGLGEGLWLFDTEPLADELSDAELVAYYQDLTAGRDPVDAGVIAVAEQIVSAEARLIQIEGRSSR